MSAYTGESTTASGLDFEETELKLAPPGRSGNRWFGGDTEEEEEEVSPEIQSGEVAGKRPPTAQVVVGWPPVRNFRKSALKSGGGGCTATSYVKVAVDGAPYLRKVDLEFCAGYAGLLAALQQMFLCFTICNQADENRLVDPRTGMEYVPTYEDKDGDWMLVGDVPWQMFTASCKRIRLKKSTESIY